MHDFATQFVLDMDANDLVKGRFAAKSEAERAARVEAARPAGDDTGNQRVRLAADAGSDLIARNPAQRRDLLGNGAADAGHGEIDARSELRGIDPGRMNQEPDRGARAGVPMHDTVVDRAHDDGRQPNADTVDEAAARIVGKQEFDYRLLRTVRRQRRQVEIVSNGLRKRRAEHRDRRSEHEPRAITVTDAANRFEQGARAVEIDPRAFFEIEFRFPGNHRGQMEYDVRPRIDERS